MLALRASGPTSRHRASACPPAAKEFGRRLFDNEVSWAAVDALEGEADGFAVAGLFAVRNPSHEEQVRTLLQESTGLPVTCSHELSSRLGGPKRALTTLLNARLIPVIHDLIVACRGYLGATGIEAPLMIVRGDGTLVQADFAGKRPIETILSGPAASLVGAQFLLETGDAIVSDIGGTTTDVAVLNKGWPRVEEDGAIGTVLRA